MKNNCYNCVYEDKIKPFSDPNESTHRYYCSELRDGLGASFPSLEYKCHYCVIMPKHIKKWKKRLV